MHGVVDIEDWVRDQGAAPIPEAQAYRVRLWDGDGFDEKRAFNDVQPTARQILEAFDRLPADEHELLYLPRGGTVETIDLDETIDLRERGPERFFAFKTDRLFNFMVNGRRFEWGAPSISADRVRLVARVPHAETIYLERSDEADRELGPDDDIWLTDDGLERFSSRKQSWKLQVQGVILNLTTPLVSVKSALAQAGFDPNAGWISILKRKGEAKLQVALDYEIDLRLPGIEKLRITPAQIQNGEALNAPRRSFPLLDKDEAYLNERGLLWETLVEGGRRWLILRHFMLPAGYNHGVVDIAIDVPAQYPRAEIDMFHCFPHLTLKSGGVICATTGRTSIQGHPFQQWSRHLYGQTRWNPTTDSVMTHLAVIDAALSKEVGE
jgi:hypothetical protein